MVSNIGGYIADPISRKNLRKMANNLRRSFSLENELSFPIVNVLEILVNNEYLNVEICSIEEMGTKFGETIPSQNLIKIREYIYMIRLVKTMDFLGQHLDMNYCIG